MNNAVDELFRYAEPAPPDVMAARAWRPERGGMCGCAANRTIIDTYDTLDRAFSAYLGDPPLASWITFAKYSAREVGGWIRASEGFMTIARAVGPSVLALAGGLRASGALFAALASDGINPAMMARQLSSFAQQPADRRSFRRATGALFGDVERVRDALVEANTEIFFRIARAFHVFLGAESHAEDSLAAIRAAGVEDPMGYLAEGFVRYRRARELGVVARSPERTPDERRPLLAIRRQLIAEANWLIAVQEQALLQRSTVFDSPAVRAAFGSARPGELTLSLAPRDGDALPDRFTLLPEGGNWADYATRMGLREIDQELRPEGVILVTFPESITPRAFVLDPTRRGTVLDLFSRYLDGPACANLLRGRPRRIAPITLQPRRGAAA